MITRKNILLKSKLVVTINNYKGKLKAALEVITASSLSRPQAPSWLSQDSSNT